jgi:high affinity Mn2+ porin
MESLSLYCADKPLRRERLCAIVCLIVFFTPTSTLAADASPTIMNWAGMYLGASLGATFPTHAGERLQAGSGFGSPVFDLYPGSLTRTGVTVGAQMGHNWQHGPFVWGFESDFSLLDGRQGPNGSFPAPTAYAPAPLFYTLQQNTSANYFASLRARAGYAYDRTLFYLTGGVAAGGARGPGVITIYTNGSQYIYPAPWSQSSRMKYAFGAGFEYALTNEWTARAEYLFLSQSLNTQIFDDGAGYQYISRIRNENSILRFGMNYYFGEVNELSDQPNTSGESGGKDDDGGPERYSFHGASTTVVQAYPKFRARYDGSRSLPSGGQGDALTQNDLFFGLRLWKGAAAYINPEADMGYGLGNSAGAAAYVNSLAMKIGRNAPYMRFQRYFLRQIIGISSDNEGSNEDVEGTRSELLESLQNQLSGKVDRDRITVTIGKFAVGDIFDDNLYAHDPSEGFVNFAFNSMGALDYAADAWGYTNGVAVEWRQNWWTARAGTFQLSTIPNGQDIEPELFRQYMAIGELEGRYELLGQPGEIKLLAFGDNGNFAKFRDVNNLALITGNLPPDVTSLRNRHFKPGGGINIEQKIIPSVGFFMRASLTDGRYQTVDSADVDHQISAGVLLAGGLWQRKEDTIGLAAAASGISGDHARYFALGGRGTYVGDGALSYAGEKNFEAFYKLGLNKNVHLTFDYQLVANPGYNSARGPVNIFGVRLRAGF